MFSPQASNSNHQLYLMKKIKTLLGKMYNISRYSGCGCVQFSK